MNNLRITLNEFIELKKEVKKYGTHKQIDQNGEEYIEQYGIKIYHNNETIEHRDYKDRNKYKLTNN